MRTRPGMRLDVKSRQAVPGQSRTTDGNCSADTALGSVPVLALDPFRPLRRPNPAGIVAITVGHADGELSSGQIWMWPARLWSSMAIWARSRLMPRHLCPALRLIGAVARGCAAVEVVRHQDPRGWTLADIRPAASS